MTTTATVLAAFTRYTLIWFFIVGSFTNIKEAGVPKMDENKPVINIAVTILQMLYAAGLIFLWGK